MHPIELLEKQHEETLAALKELEESEAGSKRKKNFDTLQRMLLAHMTIEEELFYPAVAAAQSEGEPIAEGYEEHVGARAALERCARGLAEDELFQVRIGVLTEMIKHHVKEERNEIFPRAKKALASEDLSALGEAMEERFEKAKRGKGLAGELNRKATNRAKRSLEAGPAA